MRPLHAFDGTAMRTVGEDRMVDHLLVWGHVHDLRAGRAEPAKVATRHALERWIGKGLPFERSATGGRLFDPAEVMNTFIHAGQQGEDGFWAERYVATARQLVRDSHASLPDGGVPSPLDLQPRHYRVRLERDFDLSGFTPGTRLHLRLPRPLEDHALRNLRTTAMPLEGAEIAQEPGRFDYRLAANGQRHVTIAFDAEFDASSSSGGGEPLAPGERELYTRLSDGLVHAGRAVLQQARSLALQDLDDAAVAQRLFEHVMDSVSCGVMQYGDIDMADPTAKPLATGWCDCQMAASLFCAFCRAQGIPARVVSGYPLQKMLAAHHYWAEAWLEGRGWVPYDFMAWHLSRAGRDVQWRNIFAGAVDHRMKLQVLPRLFTGVGSIRFPRHWHMVVRGIAGGVEVAYEEAATGELVYRDRFFVLQ